MQLKPGRTQKLSHTDIVYSSPTGEEFLPGLGSQALVPIQES